MAHFSIKMAIAVSTSPKVSELCVIIFNHKNSRSQKIRTIRPTLKFPSAIICLCILDAILRILSSAHTCYLCLMNLPLADGNDGKSDLLWYLRPWNITHPLQITHCEGIVLMIQRRLRSFPRPSDINIPPGKICCHNTDNNDEATTINGNIFADNFGMDLLYCRSCQLQKNCETR
jgi:hypothetical protein